MPTISVSSAVAEEGNLLAFTVALSEPSAVPVSFGYVVADGYVAGAGADGGYTYSDYDQSFSGWATGPSHDWGS